VKERPILFSAPMVRAILAGTKTQTRRVVKPDGKYRLGMVCPADGGPSRCPYGAPGDRLWVRETFQPLLADGFDHDECDWKTGRGYRCSYVATAGRIEVIDRDDNITDRCKPGIHMPRWASRITLEVTGVRVERLQDISEADARAEGVSFVADGCARFGVGGAPDSWCDCPVTAYCALWESINGKDSWAANPWVWVVEFKRDLA
jgi:hypothetical protein